jgi:deazaflavin-dependent oxidoreductase (nitroreductase family)
MPSDRLLKTTNAFHKGVIKLTGGRLGWKAGSMTVLELTTTGRKSGQQRTVLLTSPVKEGDAFVIIASKGGEPTHPAWFLNLQANPECTVSLRGATARPMRARVARGEERARLWPAITGAYKGYASYQRKTDREIPVVFLEPVA